MENEKLPDKSIKVVFIIPVGSHQASTFGFAKELVELGFAVTYAGTEMGIYGENLKENAVSQGFNYVILDPFVRIDFGGTEKQFDENKKEFLSYAHNLLEGQIFSAFVNSTSPDLIFLDIHLPLYAIALHPFNIPVAFVSTELFTGRTESSAPLTSTYITRLKGDTDQHVAKLWTEYIRERPMNSHLQFLLNELSSQNGFPIETMLDERCIVLFGLKYPELVLWPKEFEFRPLESKGASTYIGSYIDFARKQSEVGVPGEIDPSKDHVYFAIGSLLNDKNLITHIAKFLKAFALLPGIQFTVSAGRLYDDLTALHLPSNVRIFKFVQQLSILQKVKLMITLGGGNSIKECIYHSVPMLCYPYCNDQFGNSARVVYHGLGEMGDLLNDSTEHIADQVGSILSNEKYRHQMRLFHSSVQDRLERRELTAMIERLMNITSINYSEQQLKE